MKVKVKLRDMTPDQWKKWERETCLAKRMVCSKCPFRRINCGENIFSKTTSWIMNKDILSDKFLDQEVEIEEDIEKWIKEINAF